MAMSPSPRQSPWGQTLAVLLLATAELSFLICKTKIMVKPPSKRGVFYGRATEVLTAYSPVPASGLGLAMRMGVPATGRAVTQGSPALLGWEYLLR